MKHGTQKIVTVVGHQFNCLPAHVQITGKGTGSSIRVAAMRAIESMICDRQLRHLSIGSFKMTASVAHGTKPEKKTKKERLLFQETYDKITTAKRAGASAAETWQVIKTGVRDGGSSPSSQAALLATYWEYMQRIFRSEMKEVTL
jgi:hypothetical protein